MSKKADYGIPEAAALLGQTERQVRYAINQGRLTASKRAGRWVIPAAELGRHRGPSAESSVKSKGFVHRSKPCSKRILPTRGGGR